MTGDVAATLRALTAQVERKPPSADAELLDEIARDRAQFAERAAAMNGVPIHPMRLVHELQRALSDDMTLCLDMGSFHIWLARHLYSFRARQVLISNGQQTLGVGLPWAIAACLVRPGEKVISISGDGGFLYSAGELETAVRLKCNLVHLVWIDGAYDMVRFQEVAKYGRASGVEFGPVDVVTFAESFGARGLTISQPRRDRDHAETGPRAGRTGGGRHPGGLPGQPPPHGDRSPHRTQLRSPSKEISNMTANMSVAKRGIDLLRDPQLNKSTAFTEAEREALGLTGLLPAAVDTEETQVQRVLQQLGQKPTDLERYIYLIRLLDTDETLFYKVLMSDPVRFLPIVYDPTVGEACLKFGHIFRRPARHVPLPQAQGARQGRASQLAGEGRPGDLRDVRRPHPRSG